MQAGLCMAACLLLLHTQVAVALSWSLCETYNAEWVTSSPRLRGNFPHASLLFNCDGGINIEGISVDACIGGGQMCGQAAADAFCKYVGFDGASPDTFDVEVSDEPTRAMTGEWCMFAGKYEVLGDLNRTQYEALNASTAALPRCGRLASVTCFRTRLSLTAANGLAYAAGALASSGAAPAMAPAPLAAPVVFPVGAAVLETPLRDDATTALQAATVSSHASPEQSLSLASGGRRLMS